MGHKIESTLKQSDDIVQRTLIGAQPVWPEVEIKKWSN